MPGSACGFAFCLMSGERPLTFLLSFLNSFPFRFLDHISSADWGRHRFEGILTPVSLSSMLTGGRVWETLASLMSEDACWVRCYV